MQRFAQMSRLRSQKKDPSQACRCSRGNHNKIRLRNRVLGSNLAALYQVVAKSWSCRQYCLDMCYLDLAAKMATAGNLPLEKYLRSQLTAHQTELVTDRRSRGVRWQLKRTGHSAKSRSWLLEVQCSRQKGHRFFDRDCLQIHL